MRVLLQRVKWARVDIGGEVFSSIGEGYLLFVGFRVGDAASVVPLMAQKILSARLFEDASGKTNLSLKDTGGSLLSVSQFTLYASYKEGHRPSFSKTLGGKEAKPLYELFNDCLRAECPDLKTGVFGADMKVSLLNDGPFTALYDSDELFGGKKP